MNIFHIALPWIKPSSDPTAVSQIVAGTSKERHKFLPRSFASTAVQAWSYTLLHPPIFSTLHPFGVWRFPSICINAYNSGCGWTPAIWLVQLSLKILDSDHFYVIEKGLASAYINYCLSKQHIQGNGKKKICTGCYFLIQKYSKYSVVRYVSKTLQLTNWHCNLISSGYCIILIRERMLLLESLKIP